MKFLLLLLVLYNIIYSAYSVSPPTVTAVSNGKFGSTSTYVTITGTLFANPLAVTIADQPCTSAALIGSTQIQCIFSYELNPANLQYDVVVKVGGVASTGGTGLFKYTVPSVSAVFQDGGKIGMLLANAPPSISGYKLNVSDSINSNLLSVTADSTSAAIYFVIPNTIIGGTINLELIQPYSFSSIKSTTTLFTPVITSVTPTTLNLTPTNVTITGNYFGVTVSVTMGTHIFSGLTVQDNGSNGQVVFTTRSVYESPNTISVQTSTGVTINATDGQGNTIPTTFTYNPPTIVSVAQTNDKVEITTTNTGTDITQISLTMGTSTVSNLAITGTNDNLVATLPHALPEGETQFNMKAGTSQIISSSLLIAPILSSVTDAPYNGGSITISGIFLNNAHVSFQNKTEIVCAPNSNGESIVCPVEAGSGTLDLVVTNYKSFAVDPSVKTEASITVNYTTAPVTPTPSETTPSTPTPSETDTPKPTETSKPTTTPEETEAPSSATTLLSPLSLIFIFISFVLLI
ncbi:hypothetical protein ACTA71_001160 [Dictyostelium dimigraforme]